MSEYIPKKVEFTGDYSVVVENDKQKKTTQLIIADWQLAFYSKQAVVDHVNILTKALEFWEFDNEVTK